MPKPNKKPAAKKKPAPAAKKQGGPAKVLQHPSSAKASPAPTPARQEQPRQDTTGSKPKKEPLDWTKYLGLKAGNFDDLIERRQTMYHKYKELELKIKGPDKKSKDYEDKVKLSLDWQIKEALKRCGIVPGESVQVEERLVSPYTGHTPERIDKDKLLIALMDHLEPEVIEEVINASTEGGEAYIALRITEPKEKE